MKIIASLNTPRPYQGNPPQASEMIRVLLVDDQKSIRERLKSILATEPDLEIVGMVDNGYDAIELVKQLEPDVVLMDMEMPDIDGVLATKIISHSELSKKVRILVLSSYDSNEYVKKSIHAGAKGYLLKGASAEEICDAVRFVHRGYTQIAPGLFEQFIPQQLSLTAEVNNEPRQISTELDMTGLSSLALTGFKIQKRVSTKSIPAVFSDPHPSDVVVDVIPTHIETKSLSWLQVVAIVLAGLGLTGGIYLVRQSLRQPLSTIAADQAQQLQEIPFVGKIEPTQVVKINATVPGFIRSLQVKLGQTVRSGEPLLTIQNVDAERSNQEKAQQQQQQALQQQQSQQQQSLQQQQNIIQQQQTAQQRIAILEQQIMTYNQTIAPLRAKIASSNLQLSQGQLQSNQVALIQQKKEAVQKAQAIFQRQQIEYRRKQALYESKQRLYTAGGTSRDQVEQVKAEADSASVEVSLAQSDLNNAQQSLLIAQKNRAESQPVESQRLQLQQQLTLKEQEEQIRKFNEQLRQEQLNYQQLTVNLQKLRQQSIAPPASPLSVKSQPVLMEVAASTTGHIVELPINNGDQVFTGTKLLGIAQGQQMKVTVEVEEKLTRTLQIGKKAIVQIKNNRDTQEFSGRVANISPPGENHKQRVEVEFSAGEHFLAGQLAAIYFPQ